MNVISPRMLYTTMIRTIIIDDERKGRETLLQLLKNYCPEVEVVASVNSVRTAVDAMNEYHPDLILLDVEMPSGNGFELLEKTSDLHYEVIFTTAYDQYAIPAIKSDALDYLLKPIDRDELINAVSKAQNRITAKRTLIEGAADASPKHRGETHRGEGEHDQKKIILSTSEGLTPVRIQDIVRCRAEANYTRFYMCDRSEILVSRTLKNFEAILSNNGFVRVHYSHLVNMQHVTKYIRGEGGQVIMSDGATVMVSRRRKDELMRELMHR